MAVRNYNAKKVACIVGAVMLTGFHDGDKVSVERNEDTFTFQPDTDGGGTRSRNNNTSGRFTFTLSQTSPVNAALSALAMLDETAGAGAVPILVKDAGGLSSYGCETAWCVKPPTGDFTKESGPRVWIFETEDLKWFEGGN